MIVPHYLSYTFFSVIMAYSICKARGKTYLHALQQDNYSVGRFFQWLFAAKALDTKMTISLVSYILVMLALNHLHVTGIKIHAFYIHVSLGILATALLTFHIINRSTTETSRLEHSKIPLKLTARAKRILYTFYGLSAVLYFCMIVQYHNNPWYFIGFLHCMPFLLIAATALNAPSEQFIQKSILSQAQDKLNKINPVVIGVTGSFGKTSVKKILGHILSKHKPTLATPGSVNTPMGISRIINEELKFSHHYFVVEMGAYTNNSIKKICDLTNPQYGVITSIGPCHLERFGSIENIVTAKSELIDHIISSKAALGYTFNETLIQFDMLKNHSESTLMKPLLECVGSDHSINGVSLTLRVPESEEKFELHAPIYGQHQIDNIRTAASVAVHLGVPTTTIAQALRSLPQTSARLEVKEDTRNITWINDGYNANPEGFISGLTLLSQFGAAKSGRKILVTPGIIELGNAHEETHEMLAKEAIKHCDIIIVVASKRIQTFVKACQKHANSKQCIMETATFNEARKWLQVNQKSKDTILIANDLPDILESRPNI